MHGILGVIGIIIVLVIAVHIFFRVIKIDFYGIPARRRLGRRAVFLSVHSASISSAP